MQHLFNENIEALTQASLIFVLGVVIILTNLIVIATFINFRGECVYQASIVVSFIDDEWLCTLSLLCSIGPQEVINIYLLSLAFADLICGLVIVPLSIYPALQSGTLTVNWISTRSLNLNALGCFMSMKNTSKSCAKGYKLLLVRLVVPLSSLFMTFLLYFFLYSWGGAIMGVRGDCVPYHRLHRSYAVFNIRE